MGRDAGKDAVVRHSYCPNYSYDHVVDHDHSWVGHREGILVDTDDAGVVGVVEVADNRHEILQEVQPVVVVVVAAVVVVVVDLDH